MFTLSPGIWWFWLTALTSVLVACYEVDTPNSERHMIALFMKFAIVTCSGVLYWVIAHTLCTRSQSLNTHKIIPSKITKRATSLKYGILEANSSFKWIIDPHSKYIQEADGTCAYTVLRTVDKYNLFQFNMHLKRLLHTIHAYNDIVIPSRILRKLLITNIRNGLDEFYNDYIVHAKEVRIMISVDFIKFYKLIENHNYNNTNIEKYLAQCLLIHFACLPELQGEISVCIRIGRHKFNKQSKTTKWANERHKFQKNIDKKLNLNEIIMTEIIYNDNDECDGYLMEGLSSNFAVLQNNNLLLTPSVSDGILPGTVRGFVIDLYKEMADDINNNGNTYNIPKGVIYGKPLFSDIVKWKGMVLMSTSRLVLPIHNVYIDIEDDILLKLVGNNKQHCIFDLQKSNDAECGYRKIVYQQEEHKNNELQNLRVFIKRHMKTHSVYVGSVFNT